MNVTKCDCCGKIVGNNEAFKLNIATLKSSGVKDDRICKLEICDTCRDTVMIALGLKEPEVVEPETPEIENPEEE